MKTKFPDFKTDAEAEELVATADLSEYDLSDMTPMRFELRKKDKAVSLRLPEKLYEAVKARAERAGIPYQRFIRMAIEQALQHRQNGRNLSRQRAIEFCAVQEAKARFSEMLVACECYRCKNGASA